MRHRISFFLTYACIAAFGVLGVLLLVLGDKESRVSETENRMLSGFPELSAQSVGDGTFMSGLESYLSDGMPSRERIVSDTAVWMNALSLDRDSHDEDLFNAVEAYGEVDEPYEPTPEPTEASVPQEPTEAPLEELTPEPTPVPTEAPTPEPVEATAAPSDKQPTEAPRTKPTATPQVTATPKPVMKIKDCSFRQIRADGTFRTTYTFPAAHMQTAIDAINAYRKALPDDGHLFFTQVPFPSIAFSLQNGSYVSWECDVEELIDACSLPGVEVVSAPEVLKPHLLAGEDLYFHTDHHWKPLAACYVAQAMLERIGIHALSYDDYSYYHYSGFYGSLTNEHPEMKKTTKADTIDVMIPMLPVKGYTIAWNGTKSDCPFMLTKKHSYLAYLGGTLGPWRCYETGVDCNRRCLVIGDSYICCFTPYLAPYYEEVHTVDFRKDYYDAKNRKWTVREYLKEHEIDDIYVVLSTATSINSSFMLDLMQRYL